MRTSKRFHRLQFIVEDTVAQWGLQHEMDLHHLARHWEDVVGFPIALHSAPERIRFHTLTLGVDSAPWKNELVFYKAEILRKANLFFKKPLIREVVLKIVPPYPKKMLSDSNRKDNKILPRDISDFDESINTLHDPALQEAVRHALIQYTSSIEK